MTTINQRVYRIGALAAATQLTPDALRYYERLGLLPKPPRSPGGFRMFGPEAVERIQFIRQAQALGLSLSEIRQLVGFNGQSRLTQCRQVRPLLRARLTELDARLSELRAFRRSLVQSLDDCERRLADRPDAGCPVVEQLEKRAAHPRGRSRKARKTTTAGVRPIQRRRKEQS